MTATQLLFYFLKTECTIGEMRFFKYRILTDHGNKFFKRRGLYTKTFAEDYLSRNNRALNNLMTRLFILSPNLVWHKSVNPRYKDNRNEWLNDQFRRFGEIRHRYYSNGMYVNYYKRKWNEFLRNKVVSEKKISSPFKKGEVYDFKLIDQV